MSLVTGCPSTSSLKGPPPVVARCVLRKSQVVSNQPVLLSTVYFQPLAFFYLSPPYLPRHLTGLHLHTRASEIACLINGVGIKIRNTLPKSALVIIVVASLNSLCRYSRSLTLIWQLVAYHCTYHIA